MHLSLGDGKAGVLFYFRHHLIGKKYGAIPNIMTLQNINPFENDKLLVY